MQAPPSKDPRVSMQDSVIGGNVNVTSVHHHHSAHHQFPPSSQGVSRDQVAAQLMQISQGKNKKFNPELAAVLSLIFPGSGYIQIGKMGLGWSVLFIALIFLVSSKVGFMIYFAMGLGTAFHAYTLAHQFNGDLVHI